MTLSRQEGKYAQALCPLRSIPAQKRAGGKPPDAAACTVPGFSQ